LAVKKIAVTGVLLVVGCAVAAIFWFGAGAQGVSPLPIFPPGLGGGATPVPGVPTVGQNWSGQGPVILVSPGKLTVENPVVVEGHQFPISDTVALSVAPSNGGQARDVGKAQADRFGNFSGFLIHLPQDSALGPYTVTGVSQTSGVRSEAHFVLVGKGPYVVPETYAAKSGAVVSYKGGGFTAGEAISYFFDTLSQTPLGTIVADAQGSFSLQGLTVPLATEGNHAVLFVGARSQQLVRVPITVIAFHPWVVLDNYTPKPYDQIGFSGQDFRPGEGVVAYLNQVAGSPVAIVQADAKGAFTAKAVFSVPVDAVGKDVLIFIGTQTQTQVSVSFQVMPLTPSLELSKYAGVPGTVTSFKGSQFAHSETIHAYLGKGTQGPEVATFQSDARGTFLNAGEFAIPADTPPGDQTITVQGELSKVPVSIVFTVLAPKPWGGTHSTLSPTGFVLTFTGGGFLVGETVTVTLSGSNQVVATATTDQNGGFDNAGRYKVPIDQLAKITFVFVGDKSHIPVEATFFPAEALGTPSPATPTP
jgi:hypothetical protein